jgi:hypothetical protein
LGKKASTVAVTQPVVDNTQKSAYFGETLPAEKAAEKKSLLNSKDMQDLFQGLDSNEDLDFLDEINNTVAGASKTKKLSPILTDSIQVTALQTSPSLKFETVKTEVPKQKTGHKSDGTGNLQSSQLPKKSSETVPYSNPTAKSESSDPRKLEEKITEQQNEKIQETEPKNRNPWNKNKPASSAKVGTTELKAQANDLDNQNLMFSFGGVPDLKSVSPEKPKELKRKNTKDADPLLRQLSDSVHFDLDMMSDKGYSEDQELKGKRHIDEEEYDYFSEQNLDSDALDLPPKKKTMNFNFHESEDDSFSEQIKTSLKANSKLFKSEVKENQVLASKRGGNHDRSKPIKARRATTMEEDFIDTKPVQYQFTEEDKANKVKLNPETINQILNSNANNDM